MKMANKKFLPVIRKLQKLKDNLATIVGNEVVNFTQENFKKQRFQNSGEKNWKARKPNRDSKKRQSRAVLIDSGRLFRSIRITQKTRNSVRVGTDVPYAKVHNEGFKGKVKQRVRRHTRTRRGNSHSVKSHNRNMKLNIPKRKFLGKSYILNRRIARRVVRLIKKSFK